MIAVAAALVSAKTLPFCFGLVFASFIAAAAWRGRLRLMIMRSPAAANWYLAAFLIYAAVSSAWAIVPSAALVTTIYALTVAFAAVLMQRLVRSEDRPNLLHMGEGLWLGLAAALLYLSIELATGQSIKILLYNLAGLQPGDLAPPEYFRWLDGKLISVRREDLTRNMAPLTVFLWPVVAAIMGSVSRRFAVPLSTLLVLVAGIVVMTARHETSKGVFALGLAIFFATHMAPKISGRLVSMGWVLVCLGMLPAALLAHRFELQKAPWIQDSAQHRIIIWNYTAEQVLHTPLFGRGARTTYFLGPGLKGDETTAPDEKNLRTLSTHAHSVFLQTWFELGLVGATLLTLFGLALVQSIMVLPAAVKPYALATFVSCAVMAASSYGMWQYWYMAMFALCAVLFAVGAELLNSRQVERSEKLPGDFNLARP